MFKDAVSLHKYLNILRACFNPFHVGSFSAFFITEIGKITPAYVL